MTKTYEVQKFNDKWLVDGESFNNKNDAKDFARFCVKDDDWHLTIKLWQNYEAAKS